MTVYEHELEQKLSACQEELARVQRSLDLNVDACNQAIEERDEARAARDELARLARELFPPEAGMWDSPRMTPLREALDRQDRALSSEATKETRR